MQTLIQKIRSAKIARVIAFAMVLVLPVFITSCGEDDGEEPVPTITSVDPNEGVVGATITITGTNLADATEVKFGTVAATIGSKSATSIVTTVPAGAVSAKISVTTQGGTASSSVNFNVVVPVPTITSFAPTNAEVGETVTITGTNLADATEVKFGTVAATITSKTATTIVTSVPVGATTGKIFVKTPVGEVTSSADFTVILALPEVTSISPGRGDVGTEVTIRGTNLDNVTDVEFGGVAATIVSQTSTSLVTTIPAGAASGVISVISDAGEAESPADFEISADEIEQVVISDFEEENADEIWGIAQDAGTEVEISAIDTEEDNAFFHLKAKDINTNHWVGGRYFEVNIDSPLGVEESDMTNVWMNVDVKSIAALSIGKLVYTVKEAGGPDGGRRNYEIDFNVDWAEWKTISIRLDKFGYYDPAIGGMKRAHETNPDVPTIWSVALFVKGGNGTDTYDIVFDNLQFSEGGPLGEDIEGF
jgi:hypothetical protein